MAYERVTLYGLPLVARRRVDYAQIEPELARELFIRHALVEGDWQTRHHFFRDNARLREELEELEERARRRDLLVGDDDDLRLLRRPHPGRGRLGAALRRVVEEAAAPHAGPADVHPRRSAAHRGRPPPTSRTPGRRVTCRCR